MRYATALIQIRFPDDLVDRLERLAERLRINGTLIRAGEAAE